MYFIILEVQEVQDVQKVVIHFYCVTTTYVCVKFMTPEIIMKLTCCTLCFSSLRVPTWAPIPPHSPACRYIRNHLFIKNGQVVSDISACRTLFGDYGIRTRDMI